MSTEYKRKIYALLHRLEKAKAVVRYTNRPAVEIYIAQIRPLIDQMMSGFQESANTAALLPHFRLYMDEEECRLRDALDIIHYDLDAVDTLKLVMGHRSLEKVSCYPRLS